MKNKKLAVSGKVLLGLGLTEIIAGLVFFYFCEICERDIVIFILFFLLAAALMIFGILKTLSGIFAVKAAGQKGKKPESLRE